MVLMSGCTFKEKNLTDKLMHTNTLISDTFPPLKILSLIYNHLYIKEKIFLKSALNKGMVLDQLNVDQKVILAQGTLLMTPKSP